MLKLTRIKLAWQILQRTVDLRYMTYLTITNLQLPDVRLISPAV